jgi:hypothetical protein
MKAFVFIMFSVLFLNSNSLKAQSKSLQKFPGTPFQGTNEYCDYLKPLKFKISITGFNVTITKYYDKEKPKVVKGIYRKGKLFTNDPVEKQFHAGGKYYVLYTTSFGINNLEGGDYEYFELCK